MKAEGRSRSLRTLTGAALLLALAVILPFFTGQIPKVGAMLCPMHFPVLLCGFLCGGGWGLAVGLTAPLLRSVCFGLPKLYPSALAMCLELAAYGAVAGVLYRRLPGKRWAVYVSLLSAMTTGRLVWGLTQTVLLGLSGKAFTLAAFFAGAVSTSVPGILLQLALLPPLVLYLKKRA